jgi:hypothetical protein
MKKKDILSPDNTLKAVADEPISFFTEMDLDKDGNIKASYPFYFNKRRMENSKMDLNRLERMVENKEVPNEFIGDVMDKIRNYKKELEALERYTPKAAKNLDRIKKLSDTLKDYIAPSLFTRREMNLGLVDPHEESTRMSEPKISVNSETAAAVVKNGGRVDNGKVSRDDLTRLYQMCQHSLGEPGDVEYLRKD